MSKSSLTLLPAFCSSSALLVVLLIGGLIGSRFEEMKFGCIRNGNFDQYWPKNITVMIRPKVEAHPDMREYIMKDEGSDNPELRKKVISRELMNQVMDRLPY
jgi:hypothetical protein